MLLNTFRFGEIEVREDEIITFKEGLPGLPDLKRFVLLSPQKDIPIKWLQSVDNASIALVVISTCLYLEDYCFEIDEEDLKRLEIENTEDMAVFSVVVIPEDIKKMTANFAAPIVINIKNRLAKQIILTDSKYQVRTPVYELYQNVRLRRQNNACINP